MKYQTLRKHLSKFVVFSVSDIRKIEPSFYRNQLDGWQDKGYIKKLRRGYYMFADTALSEEVLFLVANRLYTPSYVSFESALSYYGLIPEGVYSITSASGKKTKSFRTPIAEFTYRRIRPQFLFGYNLRKQGDQAYKIAKIEKAVLDYLHLNPKISQAADFYEWRFNSQEFLSRADISMLRRYAKAYNNKSLIDRLEKLLELIEKSK